MKKAPLCLAERLKRSAITLLLAMIVTPADTLSQPILGKQRLFDMPGSGSVSDLPGSEKLKPETYKDSTRQLLLSFNGVLQHGEAAEIWVDNQPLSLWNQTTGVQKVRWNRREQLLDVFLPRGMHQQLAVGQALYSTGDGDFHILDQGR